METFFASKRRKLDHNTEAPAPTRDDENEDNDGESTDFKIAVLASLHTDRTPDVLLDYLLAYHGSVEQASEALSAPNRTTSPRKRPGVTSYQSSLSAFARPNLESTKSNSNFKTLTKKGKTLHLYSPEDIEAHTPCSIVHNFLTSPEADALLRELLGEVPDFRKETFQLFDRTVESPHTMKFYVDSSDEAAAQRTEYVYNGSYISDVTQTRPEMLKISSKVQNAVNREIERRIQDFYPEGEKLKFQSPDLWQPNASFVNCYDGAKESVGYHSDQLTYLGPRAVIGSLSLGVARDFRVRKIVPQVDHSSADAQGQIAIHLPHNSLLIMHAEMQEEWKHSIAPAQTIDPHPVAGNKRLNVTYRCYKDYLHPKYTPKCKCDIPAVLRCVQKRASTRGRYMWMCHSGYTPGQKGCSYFSWAEFDEDGRPPWANGYKGNVNLPPIQGTDGDRSAG
ncbi:hypothetical protein KC332_g13751 [Hortaea werneckii]|uniref:Uncharacterized protein n=1 Tax=Hortaea werneckii TaxID=91943 RepID=A0A3M7IRB1_HORWE|nr:hypothetical protein KC358_g14005 [Hortaea werneckii]KAI6808887.1 hypothetical protein KC350_g13147 [Hortaea werneckii]KAI6909395.1 hypothetical protein KC348_g13505 [Hortaea werneckii]KAI6925852.1 hypothetical protein KC341_g13136 [Hortaea werneckii]KAI6959092.1 hypothetical protein KC321_g13624 [Hortaea werneckii]